MEDNGNLSGALFGAVIQAIDVVTDAIGEAATVGKDLSVQSIKLAADFQKTTNSLAVFTGSIKSAKNELSAVSSFQKHGGFASGIG